jgi:wyosine [tRNA(Phe)-imidazoG37] synthetase (radical SAM superfamily)
MNADCVSLKIDTIDENDWHTINKPEKSLNLDLILEGVLKFSNSYTGKLITETMLIDGINTDKNKLKNIAQYLEKINPFKAFLAVPIRPPAEKWVKIPSEQTINQCYQIFKSYIDNIEYLIGYEGYNFTHTRNVEEDILSITAVHPMRFDELNKILEVAKADWKLIEKLIDNKKLKEVDYYGNRFFMQPIQSEFKKAVY